MKSSLRRFICLLFLGALTAIIFVACNTVENTRVTNQQPQVEDCRIVQHSLGESCIPRHPQRIITLREDILANSLALGVKPIGSVFEPDYPISYIENKLEGIESVGVTVAPSIEKILRLKPDLILSNNRFALSIYDELSLIAPTVALNIPFPPPSWKEQLKELARVLDKEEVSQQLIDDYWQRIEALKQVLGDRRHTLEVSVAGKTAAYQIWINGEKQFSGTVLEDIGLQRPLAQRGDFFYIDNISEEKMSMIDGDVLFFIAWGTAEDLKAVEKLKQNPLWQQLNVVQRNQVYFVSGYWSNADIFAINAIVDDLFKYLVDAP